MIVTRKDKIFVKELVEKVIEEAVELINEEAVERHGDEIDVVDIVSFEELEYYVESRQPLFHSRGFSIDSGASKIALIGYDKNYVIKIASKKDGTLEREYCDNYLTIEEDIFELTVGTKIEKLFASTIFMGEYKNFVYSIQEKVVTYSKNTEVQDAICDNFISREEYSETSAALGRCMKTLGEQYPDVIERTHYLEYELECSEWLLLTVLRKYGSDTFYELVNFLYMNDINDVHNSNWGVIFSEDEKDFEIKIFDYSGYNTNTCEN